MVTAADVHQGFNEKEGTPSPFSRVLNTFVAPRKAFARLEAGTGWWLPFLLLVLVGFGYAAAVGARVGWSAVARNNVAQSPSQQARMEKLPVAQQEASYAIAARITRSVSYTLVIVGPLLFGAVVAGVLLGTLNFGFGGKARFPSVFAVYQYAALPQALKLTLVVITLALGVSGDAFQMTNPLGSNPAYYLPSLPKPALSLLSWLDVFAIWEMLLLTIGGAAAAKVSRAKAAGVVVGWAVLFALLSAGLTIFS